MLKVALNIDLGELEGEPDELYWIATTVNIACGGHAGDDSSMARAASLAARSGASIAAHPSYPDRAGFGRTRVAMPLPELEESIRAQCDALRRAVELSGGEVSLLKPHGALYHDAARDPAIAAAVLDGARKALGRAPLGVVGAGALLDQARAVGLSCLREGFADRGYRPDGGLVPRGQPGALLEGPASCAEQALKLARSGQFETLCVHADTPGSLPIARAVRHALEADGLLATGSGPQP